jgi:cytochrome c-type biogenesis protein CcmH/NrfF
MNKLFALALFTALFMHADPMLTRAAQQRAGRLYTLFVAPCCWRQSVAVHQSPEATHVRNEIDAAIEAGRTDTQIKNSLIQEYGHGILMEPEGWRAVGAYSAPALALLIGLFATLRWISRNLAENKQTAESVAAGAG